MNNDFEKNVKQQLDLSLNSLDAATQSRLTQARYKALEQAKTNNFNLGRWLTGFASAAVVALLVIMVMPTIQTPAPQQLATNNQPIPADSQWLLVSDMDEIELYQYLDFYKWLDDNASSTGSNS